MPVIVSSSRMIPHIDKRQDYIGLILWIWVQWPDNKRTDWNASSWSGTTTFVKRCPRQKRWIIAVVSGISRLQLQGQLCLGCSETFISNVWFLCPLRDLIHWKSCVSGGSWNYRCSLNEDYRFSGCRYDGLTVFPAGKTSSQSLTQFAELVDNMHTGL